MNGSRPARPQENCRPDMSNDMWRLVQDAWHQDPSIRPTMIQLEERLRSSDAISIPSPSSSATSGHRLSHRELLRLSVPQPRNPNDPWASETPTMSLFTLPNASAQSILSVTRTEEYLEDPSSPRLEPSTDRSVSSDPTHNSHAHQPLSRGISGGLDGQQHSTLSSERPIAHEKAEDEYINYLIESKQGYTADKSSATNQSHMAGPLRSGNGSATPIMWSTKDEPRGVIYHHQHSLISVSSTLFFRCWIWISYFCRNKKFPSILVPQIPGTS
jgi:hypothetical protein